MALRAMCKYSTLLTPSPSRESLTLQRPYWYRSLVTESLTFPMRTSLSQYGARVGLISVEPPSLSQGGGVMVELVITDGWVVSDIIDNSESSFVDSINRHFWQLRWSLVWAISCKHFFKSFWLGSQDLKVNLCGLQQDKRSDGKGKNNVCGKRTAIPML